MRITLMLAALALLAPGLARAAEQQSCPDATHLRAQLGQLQQQLDTLRSAQAPGPNGAPLFSLEGTVSAVTGTQLWLQDDAGNFYRLALPQGLQALQSGQHVAVGQLPEGTPVRVAARVVDGNQVAQRIEVQPTPNLHLPRVNPPRSP